MKQKIIKNTLYSGVATVFVAAIGFFLTPFIVIKLGLAQYGLVVLANVFAFTGLVSLFDFGFQATIIKHSAEYLKTRKFEKLSQLILVMLCLFFLMGFILMVLGISFSNLFASSIFRIPANYMTQVRSGFIIVFISYLFQFPSVVLVGFIQGAQRFDILKGTEMILSVLKAVIIVIVLSLGFNFLSVIFVNILIVFLRFLILFIVIVFGGFPLSFNYRLLKFDILKETAHMTKYVFICRISGLLFNSTDRFLIGIFLGPTAMASYDLILRLPRLVKSFLGFSNAAILPAASELKAINDKEKLRKLFLKGLQYQLFLAVPVVMFCMVQAKGFFVLWLGVPFGYLAPLMQFRLFYNLFIPFNTLGGTILIGMAKKLKQLTFLNIGGTLLNFIIMIIVIHNYGLYGVVFAIVTSMLFLMPFCLRLFFVELNVTIRQFAARTIPVFLVAVVPLMLNVLLNLIWPNNNLGIFSLKAFFWLGTYYLMLYFIVFNAEDRQLLSSITSKIKALIILPWRRKGV